MDSWFFSLDSWTFNLEVFGSEFSASRAALSNLGSFLSGRGPYACGTHIGQKLRWDEKSQRRLQSKGTPKLPDLFAWLGSWQLVLRFACFGFLFMTEWKPRRGGTAPPTLWPARWSPPWNRWVGGQEGRHLVWLSCTAAWWWTLDWESLLPRPRLDSSRSRITIYIPWSW